jgi:intracellular septation protein A
MSEPAPAPVGDGPHLPPVTFRAIVLGGGPRVARDAFGPIAAFYVAWKFVGLLAGIAAATVVSLAAYRYERKRERSGLIARVSLGFVVIEAAVGLISGSAELYLAQPLILSSVFGLTFIGSTLIRRPLAGVFAEEMYPLPAEVKASHTYRQVFGRISLAWGAYLILRSVVRGIALVGSGVDLFVVINFVTGFPLTAGLMAWSIWYGVRGFRRSAEWGEAISTLEAEAEGTLEVEFDPDEPPPEAHPG